MITLKLLCAQCNSDDIFVISENKINKIYISCENCHANYFLNIPPTLKLYKPYIKGEK